SENASFEFAYYRTFATLMAEGPARARREMARSGLADTSASAVELQSTLAVGPSGPLHAPMATVLRRPFDPGAHLALADACRAAGAVVFEGVELRIAAALDPSLVDARLRLARTLLANGRPPAAQRELEHLG